MHHGGYLYVLYCPVPLQTRKTLLWIQAGLYPYWAFYLQYTYWCGALYKRILPGKNLLCNHLMFLQDCQILPFAPTYASDWQNLKVHCPHNKVTQLYQDHPCMRPIDHNPLFPISVQNQSWKQCIPVPS